MKTIKISGRKLSVAPRGGRLVVAAGTILAALGWALAASAGAESKSAPIPFSEIGAKATADYQGDALGITATPEGVRLQCGFQKLEGRATAEGLWLESTAAGGGKIRLIAQAVSRAKSGRASVPASPDSPECLGSRGRLPSPPGQALAATGKISVADKLVRFTRPGLTEEYSVSVDGVRQDFVVAERPAGVGELRVELALSGARAEAAIYGSKLRLEGSGRELAYSRLRAVDATGKELAARMKVVSADRLVVRVEDGNATYPVRIDPTFSDANWISMGGMLGADRTVYAAVVAGSGNLYIGGSFTVVGDVLAKYIAKWDGTNWSALGSGLDESVNALAVSGSDVYVGGNFTTATNSGGTAVTANYIAKWDGSSWSALGSGMNSLVETLAVSGTDLYAGGHFTTAGGNSANYIAKWDGSNWSPLGSGMDSRVEALAVSGSNVYAGGGFATAGGNEVNYIAKWDGSNWSPLGSGMGGLDWPSVRTLAVSGSDLYAGGQFTTATNTGGQAVTVNYIAKWDGTNWSALGSGMDDTVETLAVSGSDVYAGGNFTTATNSGGTAVTANFIAKWNGSHWSALGSGMGGLDWAAVWALAVLGSNLYAGGDFATAGGIAANFVAKWDGTNWSALDSGLKAGINDSVSALAVSGTDLYAGGHFTAAGGIPANHIAKWDGTSWSALGSGLNYDVFALAVSGSDVYAGGNFTTAGGIAASSIAKWDGSSWSALGSGVGGTDKAPEDPGFVKALAVSGSNVYVGGVFLWATNSGGVAVTVNHVAKWDGTSWSALGLGVGGNSYKPYVSVNAFAVSGSDVYVGGEFIKVANSSGLTYTVNCIAKWNGSSWSPPLGNGLGYNSGPCWISALAVPGSNLYVGGYFYWAGGVQGANGIAKWNGSSWSKLGSGVGGRVYALVFSGSDLYVGGGFTTADGTPANDIAKWDGTNWSALGSGVGSRVSALAVSGSDLYVGGGFTIAGGKVSANIARAIINPGNWLKLQRDVPGPNTNTLTYVGIPGAQYLMQFATNLTTSPWFTLATNTPAANGRGTVLDPAATDAQRFYRVNEP